MKRFTPILLLTFACLLVITPACRAVIIWSEDFSDVSEWTVIFDQNGGSSISSDGNLGIFDVPAANNEAAFGPSPLLSPLVPFKPSGASVYDMRFEANSVSLSMSYDIRLDMFDKNTNYVGTVFNVFPQGTFVGTTNVGLGAFAFNGNTAFLMPKITVFTGDGGQTFTMNYLNFAAAVPEPSTFLLFAGGLGIIWLRRKKRMR